MCKNTIVVLGMAAASLLAVTGPAAADDYISISSCPATVTAGTGATPSSVLDTAEARRFLQSLVRSDGRTTTLYVAADPSFTAAAQFPGMLDTFLLGPEVRIAPPAAPDARVEARDVLEPLVADALGCEPAAGARTAEPSPATLLDRSGATAVLDALVNRPEACVTTGIDGGTVTARAGNTSVTADASILDSIGVRRTLDLLVGRPSACVAPGAAVSVAAAPDTSASLLDGLGLGSFLDGLLG